MKQCRLFMSNIKKLCLIAVMGLSAINVIAATVTENDNAASYTEPGDNSMAIRRDNDLHFLYKDDVKSVSIKYESSIVTDGQRYDYDFDINNTEKDQLYVRFRAGRKNSVSIANAFANTIGNECNKNSVIRAASYTALSCPGELNFLIRTTLYINGSRVINDFYLAQQGLSGSNYWYLGNKGAQIINGNPKSLNPTAQLKVKTEDGSTYYIENITHGYYAENYTFKVTDDAPQ